MRLEAIARNAIFSKSSAAANTKQWQSEVGSLKLQL